MVQPLIFRKGLDLKDAVKGDLARDYHSDVVERIRTSDFRYDQGRLTIHLAREFGFCYGVDRAVDYAYQARKRFADQRVFLTGEIIHNPHVNEKLRTAGIRFLSDPGEPSPALGEGDVVIIPAFGVTVHELARLQALGCTLVDTTCGSVLNVWKNVTRYAREGFTAVIHGKVKHEETQATASQALKTSGGRYLVVLDRAEAERRLRRTSVAGGDREAFMARFGKAVSAGFDPDRDLEHIGVANQTTMLMSESLEIADMLRQAMVDRYGEGALAERYRAFDTICSATQERQDAVISLLDSEADRPDAGRRRVQQQQHVQSRAHLRRSRADVPHRGRRPSRVARLHPPSARAALRSAAGEVARNGDATAGYPLGGAVRVGLTAGASTPNNIIGMVVERLTAFTAEPSFSDVAR